MVTLRRRECSDRSDADAHSHQLTQPGLKPVNGIYEVRDAVLSPIAEHNVCRHLTSPRSVSATVHRRTARLKRKFIDRRRAHDPKCDQPRSRFDRASTAVRSSRWNHLGELAICLEHVGHVDQDDVTMWVEPHVRSELAGTDLELQFHRRAFAGHTALAHVGRTLGEGAYKREHSRPRRSHASLTPGWPRSLWPPALREFGSVQIIKPCAT